jgi:hypothetical protein
VPLGQEPGVAEIRPVWTQEARKSTLSRPQSVLLNFKSLTETIDNLRMRADNFVPEASGVGQVLSVGPGYRAAGFASKSVRGVQDVIHVAVTEIDVTEIDVTELDVTEIDVPEIDVTEIAVSGRRFGHGRCRDASSCANRFHGGHPSD